MAQAPDNPDQETPALDVEAALDLIPVIHRHQDGGIAITRKRPDGSMEQLWYLTPGELQGMLRPIAQYLVENSYFSMHALDQPGPYRDKTTGLRVIGVDKWRPPGQRRWGRVGENLRYLNCCYADIDCGRPEGKAKNELEKMTLREAQRRVEDLQDARLIPPFSIMGHSGQGLYVIWLLRDDRPGMEAQSAPAFNWHIPLWKRLQKGIENKLVTAQLPVDPMGKSITQVYRWPDSIHGGTGNRVKYFTYTQGDQDRRLITYTLQEMAAALDVPIIGGNIPDATRALAKRPLYRRREVKNPGSAPARAAGPLATNVYRIEDLEKISAWRGGFKKRGEKHDDGWHSYGREKILIIYAGFLRGAKLDQDKALEAIRAMAATMRPPYPSDGKDTAIETIVANTYRVDTKSWSKNTLCKVFGISADTARELDLKNIRPPELDREEERALPLQAELIKARQDWARKYLDLLPNTDCRELARAYKAYGFIGANHQTANLDLNAIGYKARDHKGGRPRKAL